MELLTSLTQVQCMHGSLAQVPAPANQKTEVVSGRVLVEGDVHMVMAPCPFMKGTQPSPCTRIEWQAGAVQVSVDGKPVLTRSSIGTCYGPDGSPQGLALIASTQTQVSGQ
jgi:hypothetical protein